MVALVSRGFVVLAQNTDKIDYVMQAYALALSIQYSQLTEKSISIITNNEVPDSYKSVFDNIIEIPWGDSAKTATWKVENRWKIYHASPYDETIVLDTDMLLLDDISLWWEYCTNHDLRFCSKIRNYKQDFVIDGFHRKAFMANQLTNPYFALHYFKKSDFAHDFYRILEFVSHNWEWCYEKVAPIDYQPWLSMDLAAAVAIEIMGVRDVVIDKASPLEFVHMKTAIQGWTTLPCDWQNAVSWVLTTDGNLVVGNIRQSKLFHYVEKNFITPKLLQKLQELAYDR